MRGWGLKPGEGVEKEKASSNAANQSYQTLPDVVEVSTPRSCRGALLGYAPQPVEESLPCVVEVTTSGSRGFCVKDNQEQPVEELLSCLVVVTTSESRGF